MSIFCRRLYIGGEGRSAIAEINSAAAKSTASDAKRTVDRLAAEIQRLEMLNEAMWRLLKSRLDLSDEDLEPLIREVDLEDGRLDGRWKPKEMPVVQCPTCQRKTSVKRPVCVYCGAETAS